MSRKKQEDRGGLGDGAKLQVEQVSVADLSSDPANARKHNERNIETIVASLRRFGQQKPIVVDSSGVVRAGNGTLEAAKRLGWETIAVVKTALQGSEATAYAIADNRTAELAEWDDDVLAATLHGLVTDDAALLDAAGFDEDELAAMVGLDDDGEGGENSKPKMVISPELHERQDYIVIVFDNDFDWMVATDRLNIKTAEASKVETSTIKKTGVGRVITSQEFLRAIASE
jgi:hypothetical protein